MTKYYNFLTKVDNYILDLNNAIYFFKVYYIKKIHLFPDNTVMWHIMIVLRDGTYEGGPQIHIV